MTKEEKIQDLTDQLTELQTKANEIRRQMASVRSSLYYVVTTIQLRRFGVTRRLTLLDRIVKLVPWFRDIDDYGEFGTGPKARVVGIAMVIAVWVGSAIVVLYYKH